MNFCTRCGSYYMQPGTCNCFVRTYISGGGTVVPLTFGDDVAPSTVGPDSSAGKPVDSGVRITSTK